MDLIIRAVLNKQNVILSSMRGLERSRLLLRSELHLLTTTNSPNKISKIYHVLDKDQLIERVYYEATQMPFGEFNNISVCRYHDSMPDEPQPDPKESEATCQLVICNLKYIFDQTEAQKINFNPTGALVVFDGITIENLEGTCCEAQERTNYSVDNSSYDKFLPALSFQRLATACSSIVLACNPPVSGLEFELGCKFPIVISANQFTQPRCNVFSSILPRGPGSSPNEPEISLNFVNPTAENKSKLHLATGTMLESLSKEIDSGGIVVFFPSYGKMVEYHSAWKQSGVFERIGLPYGRENRGGDHFKNGLIKLTQDSKSIFLCSIRYHKEEDLAEFVLAQARAVVVIGLPYPFMNDTWEARIKHNDICKDSEPMGDGTDRLCGKDLLKYRAIEFLNGIIKRCLNEFRIKDCSFFLLDQALEYNRDKLAVELGDVSVESFSQAISRHCSSN